MDKPRVLIVGSGIGGIRAAIALADAGADVIVAEKKGYLGGTLMQLDSQFPDDACGICRTMPRNADSDRYNFCLRRDFIYPGVTRRTNTTLSELKGKEGDFTAVLVRDALYVDPDKCIGCGKCVDVCPVEGGDPFNKGYTKRKAISRAASHSTINYYSIDSQLCTVCGKCIEVCPTNAILLDDEPITSTERFDAVVLSPGFEEFVPTELSEYGYGRLPDVLTSLDLERLYAGTSKLIRPSDGKEVSSLAFIQCVGSRTEERDYCSAACCMYGMKEARKAKSLAPDADIKMFFMDVRASGKGYYLYERSTAAKGIDMVRCRVPRVDFDDEAKRLFIRYEDETGALKTENFDMVILSVGQVPGESVKELAQAANIDVDEYGFAVRPDDCSTVSSRDGVFIAGSWGEPKDIAATVREGVDAAAEIIEHIGITKLASSHTLPSPDPYGKIGVVLCECGGIISDGLNTDEIESAMKENSKVAFVERINLLCQPDGLDMLKQIVSEHKDNIKGVVIGACQRYGFESRFRNAMEKGSEQSLVLDMVDLRATALSFGKEIGTNVALSQMQSIVARLSSIRVDAPLHYLKPNNTAVVVGGGLSGISAASVFGKTGIKTILVEKESELGGLLHNSNADVAGHKATKIVNELVKKVQENENIEILTSSAVENISGSVGRYYVTIKTPSDKRILTAGAVIVAIGAKEHIPTSFAYGKSDNIILSDGLDELLKNDKFAPSSAVFVQCAESRTKERPWCSRFCCQKSVKQAIELKERNPKAQIYVLYRDINTFGFLERFYKKAREMGVLFLRYSEERPPRVSTDNHTIQVVNFDPLLQSDIAIEPDILILATGADPADGLSGITAMLGVETDDTGFAKVTDVKFSPFESTRAGIFFVGGARAPMLGQEAIQEGRAAAGWAMNYLNREFLSHRERIARVIERKCVGCQLCVEVCSYGARIFDPETLKVSVDETACYGCGACTVACPSEATYFVSLDRHSLITQIDMLTR